MKRLTKLLEIVVVMAAVGVICYYKGCMDTMSIVEGRADQLVKIVEHRLFGE